MWGGWGGARASVQAAAEPPGASWQAHKPARARDLAAVATHHAPWVLCPLRSITLPRAARPSPPSLPLPPCSTWSPPTTCSSIPSSCPPPPLLQYLVPINDMLIHADPEKANAHWLWDDEFVYAQSRVAIKAGEEVREGVGRREGRASRSAAQLPGCSARCCAVLCGAVLCCAVLCCAVLCCAVLCCAVLIAPLSPPAHLAPPPCPTPISPLSCSLGGRTRAPSSTATT